jgi:hypothetical protein
VPATHTRPSASSSAVEGLELTALPIWVYINLKKRISQHQAFEILRVAIVTVGVVQRNIAYEAVARERTFENLCGEEASCQ